MKAKAGKGRLSRLIKGILCAAMIFAPMSIHCAGLRALAEAPGCEAVFSVICEDGYDEDVEFTVTEEQTGKTTTVLVGKGDGYRKSVPFSPGTYTVAACVPDRKKEHEIFVDGRPQSTDNGGICHFCALVGSWLYTVENAGLTEIRDESGGPVYYGVVSSEDASSILMAADSTGSDAGSGQEDGPQEIEAEKQDSGNSTDDTAAEAGRTEATPGGYVKEDEDTGKTRAGRGIPVMLGLLTVIGGTVYVSLRRQ